MSQFRQVEWSQVLPLAKQLQATAESVAPEAPFDTRPIDAFVLGMFWRCVRMHRAAILLLEASLPEECTIIGRSLFEESLRLHEIADTAADRDSLILKWANKSIEEKKGLIRDAESLGLETDPKPILKALDDEQRDLEKYARRHGVGKLRPFLSVRAAAVKYGRKDCYWTYAWSHEVVHGSDAAWMFARRRVASDTVGLFARTDDPALLIGCASFAARSLSDAVRAVCSIFGWTEPVDLRKLSEQIDRAAQEHALAADGVRPPIKWTLPANDTDVSDERCQTISGEMGSENNFVSRAIGRQRGSIFGEDQLDNVLVRDG